ncbi:flavin oxidoreductase [Streptomyces variegatus]|jgi:flavin reductase (DIM6/NTAB) family NADH-FMN oxidoreductase RutF|uniref:Flavin oxidoreductase n=1 Tax=Streptomyces variegatus TaxID=284040 RepID=A0A0M2GX86_9ACTN|nr:MULTISPECIES: flavin reductase family protein [Streptomyces]KJK40771.1 flavin oxidoreductase [Streptomyces variegatus]
MAGMDEFIDRLNPEMYVVTAAAGGERAGCLVGFASQCSLRPVRFVVWLSELNHTFRVARNAEVLAVHLLGREQDALAERFGGHTGDRTDKFQDVPLREAYGGALVLEDVPAWFVGRIVTRAGGGDHIGFVLDPVEWGGHQEYDGPLLRLSDALAIDPGHPVD